ncbi:MAG TPA: hypothetical protein VFW73_03005, partial [Lacipirellulaceae bacterium]|nr:hypothetical protein [Lacipirellulaceae bacterium]
MADRHHARNGVDQGETGSDVSHNRFGKHDREDESADEQKSSKRPPFYRRWTVMVPLALAIIAIGIGIYLYWLYARQYEWTDDAFIAGDVTQISPKVAGYVAELDVD